MEVAQFVELLTQFCSFIFEAFLGAVQLSDLVLKSFNRSWSVALGWFPDSAIGLLLDFFFAEAFLVSPLPLRI